MNFQQGNQKMKMNGKYFFTGREIFMLNLFFKLLTVKKKVQNCLVS